MTFPQIEATHYDQFADVINLENPPVGTELWTFIAHEYGHAVHEKALGKIWANGCGDHSPALPSNMECAFAEGMAEFNAYKTVPLAVLPHPNVDRSQFDNNVFWGNPFSPPPDASRTEGAIASLLLDLVDGIGGDVVAFASSPAFADDVQLSAGFLATEIKTCEVSFRNNLTQVSTWHHVDGIDVLIYCLERIKKPNVSCQQTSKTTYYCTAGYTYAITPSSLSPYFPERTNNYTPTSWVSGNPCAGFYCPQPGWGTVALRRTWLSNLYGKTLDPGSYAPAP